MPRRMLITLAGACAVLAALWNLTCEYCENPVGLDCATPRFSWKLPARVAARRTYELELDGWPQGRIESDGMLNRLWTGGVLETGSRHSWRVRVRDGRFAKFHDLAEVAFTSRCFFRQADEVAAKMADVLGRSEEARR